MRAVLQRVKRCSVTVDGVTVGEIAEGVLVLLGIAGDDIEKEADYLVDKIANLRIFEDDQGRMNRSLIQTGGGLLVVSQFTLYADCRKGRRPSFIQAAKPDDARRLYEYFVDRAQTVISHVQAGRFQAMMDVALVNDGPVTIILDTSQQ